MIGLLKRTSMEHLRMAKIDWRTLLPHSIPTMCLHIAPKSPVFLERA